MSTFANFHEEREAAVTSKTAKYTKWEFLELAEFRTSSCGKIMSYIWLWILAFIAVAVYAADTFTAVNLLVYDKWSSEIKPFIPFNISKWIFAACIIASWVLCFYEWQRAIRVIRRRHVVESYLDPLAATLQSTRDGDGWRRFLVFAALTKSRKGADYVALFSYFQFKSAFRIVLAEGPRQVLNALTLYSVMRASIIPVGANAASDGHTPIIQFFYNVKLLADQHTEQAVILFSMLFTLVIWVFSALSLIISCILYLTFLWHYIPDSDGTLPKYCRRKVDQRLEKIVSMKIQKALRKQEEARKRTQEKAAATAPAQIGETDFKIKQHSVTVKDLGLLDLPLSRRTTETSMASQVPSYRPTRQERLAQQQPSLDDVKQAIRPGAPTRTATELSNLTTDLDDRPLLQQAASMGRVPPIRTMSNQSQQSVYSNDKAFQMPGGFDMYDDSLEDLNAYPMQPMTGHLTNSEHYDAMPPAYQTPLRMPSHLDYQRSGPDAGVHNIGRQASVTSQYSQYIPGYGMQNARRPTPPRDLGSFGRQMSGSAYSQRGASHSRRPSPPPRGDSYSSYGRVEEEQETHLRDPSTGYQVPLLANPSPPQRSATLPAVPAPTFTPPRRTGTAPPSAYGMVALPPPVFELDGAGTEIGVLPQSRFTFQRRDTDEEQGYGKGNGGFKYP